MFAQRTEGFQIWLSKTVTFYRAVWVIELQLSNEQASQAFDAIHLPHTVQLDTRNIEIFVIHQYSLAL